MEQIWDLDLTNILDDLEEDGIIVDLVYVEKKVLGIPLPLIQYSQKEATSIRDIFLSILANTTVWISNKVIQLKPFFTSSDDDTLGTVGKRSKIIRKNKQDPATP